MIRAPIVDKEFWDKWNKFRIETILDEELTFKTPSQNSIYRPQYVLNNVLHRLRYMLSLYSAGHPIPELAQHFPGLLDAWELTNRLSTEICAQESLSTCRDWDFSLSNLNHYNWCFWLVGLALCLEIPENQWQRLVVLIGGEGDDILLDRVIACRNRNRKIGTDLLHKKPYARLLKAINTPMDTQTAQTLTQQLGITPYSLWYKDDAPKGKQAALLREFVDHWYAELKRPPPKHKRSPTIEPFWYIYGDPVKHPLEMGSYFGRWCIEAAAAVKAFGMDDSLCLGHEHYPGDLLRPNGPSTHPVRTEPKLGWWAKLWSKK
jgi:Domain of unknown function (DUF1910)/Domain of unknown function (DUF1911)